MLKGSLGQHPIVLLLYLFVVLPVPQVSCLALSRSAASAPFVVEYDKWREAGVSWHGSTDAHELKYGAV